MTPRRQVSNHAASVRERLKNLSKREQVDFNRLLDRYVAERFLYRLGLSSVVDRFTLKGAAMLVLWAGREVRSTRDLDFLGARVAGHPDIRHCMETICAVACPDDGVAFDPATIQTEDIRQEEKYHGIRVKLRAALGSALLPLQIDIGFGDVITPARREAEYPTLLDLPAPRLWTYPREASIAEKFSAMVGLGTVNSRMKDFWDVALLARIFEFDGETLRSAIEETFRRRAMVLEALPPPALTPAFFLDPARLGLWRAFLNRAQVRIDLPDRFDEVGDLVTRFLGPVRDALVAGDPFDRRWPPGGPWQGL